MSIVDSIADPCRFVLPTTTAAARPEQRGGRATARSRKRKRHEIEDDRCRAAYEATDARFRDTLESVLRHDNDAVFRAATGFLLDDGARHTDTEEEGIRTALLVSGEASTNVGRLFDRVASTIVGADLVVLRPHECNNLRNAVRSLTTSVIACGRRLKVPPRALTQEMRVLKAWSDIQQVDGDRRPRVTVGIPNAESVSAGVLELLVDMLSRIDCIDFRLLLNVATSLNDLNDIFTTGCCERIDAQIFYLESGEVSTEALVTRLLIDVHDGPCFGPETFAQMLGDYQGVHRSSDLLVDAMRYASLCHHYASPLSWLRVDSSPVQLSDEDCDWLRMLPSFRAHLEEKVDEAVDLARLDRAAEYLEDNDAFRDFVQYALGAIAEYRRRLSHAFAVLDIVKNALHSGQTRRRNVDLYRMLLARGLNDHPYVNELLLRIKVVKPDVLEACLQRIVSLGGEAEVSDRAQSLLKRLPQIMQMADGAASGGRSAELKKLDSFYRADDAKRGLRKEAAPKSEYEIRAARLTRGSAYSQKVIGEATRDALTERQQAWTALVDDVHDFLADLFRENLINHEHLPLHELFWLNTSSRCHEAAFRTDLRGGVRVALAEYEQYLGDDVPTVPETSAAFRLFQDSGQLINVFDWSQAFMQQYDDEPEEQSGEDEPDEATATKKEGEEDAKTQTRQALFMRSVAELKFLGLFKATRRKTDHVQKTVLML